MQVDVVVSIRFQVEVKDKAEADGLYDKLMEKFDGRHPEAASIYLSDKIAAGSEVDVDEIAYARLTK